MTIAVLWTLLAVPALGLAAYALWDSMLDVRAVRASRANGYMALAARIGLRSALAHLVVKVMFLALGLVALFPFRLVGLLIGPAFVLALLALMAAQALNLRDRRRLRRELGDHRRP